MPKDSPKRGNSSGEIREQYSNWRSGLLSEALKKQPEKDAEVTTGSGLPLDEVYSPLDVEEAGLDYLKDINFPGQYPFTRGIEPLMHRFKPWPFRVWSGFGLPEESNERFKFLIKEGAEVIYVVCDLPSQLGFDSDDPLAEGEVGKVGVSFNTLRDWEILFNGIPLNSLHEVCAVFHANCTMGLALFLALAEKQGVPIDKCGVALSNNILLEYTCRGAYIFPIQESMRLSTDLIEWCAKYLPTWHAARMNSLVYREGGCNSIQEVAFMIADAIAYIEWTLRRGLDIDQFGRQFTANMGLDCDVFEGVAKIRAARRVWARVMKERFHAKNPETMKMRLYGAVQGMELTKEQPLNNLMRMTLQVLSGLLGGAQYITCAAHDEGIKIPSKEAARLSLRTQQVVAYESGAASVVDPLGGSWYLETLTKQIEEGVWEYLEKIDKIGGAIAAIETGFYNNEMVAASLKQEVRSRKRVKVGVNKYRAEKEEPIGLHRENPRVRELQIERLRQVRRERDNRAVSKALRAVRQAAKGDKNMVPSVLEAVKELATIGEIYSVLREVFGEYQGV
ncbi:MAG: methylmalonyl-CoA mutase [Chloroflexi bacterium]|nr:methylmalonyl-CoA mutase [Chloroflexota bacterium]